MKSTRRFKEKNTTKQKDSTADWMSWNQPAKASTRHAKETIPEYLARPRMETKAAEAETRSKLERLSKAGTPMPTTAEESPAVIQSRQKSKAVRSFQKDMPSRPLSRAG